MIDAEQSQLSSIPFSLTADPKVTRSHGHAHGPFFWGRDSYQYKGEVKFAGRRARLESQGFAPCLLVNTAGNYYLLTRGYFHFSERNFRWYALSDESEFVRLTSDRLPRELWTLRLLDSTDTRCYQNELLAQLVKQASPQTTRACFDALFARNPYFALDDAWHGPNGRRGDLQEFLVELFERSTNSEYWDIPHKLLGVVRPSDDPHIVDILCSLLIKIDPEKGHSAVCSFRQTWENQGFADDWRMLPFLPNQRFGDLQCDGPMQQRHSATTNATPAGS